MGLRLWIHSTDAFYIGSRKPTTLAAPSRVVQAGQSRPAIGGKRIGAVHHDRAKVDAARVVARRGALVSTAEVVAPAILDVLPVYPDGPVTVGTGMLVEQAQRMADFMDRVARATPVSQVDVLPPTSHTHRGGAPRATPEFHVVALVGTSHKPNARPRGPLRHSIGYPTLVG